MFIRLLDRRSEKVGKIDFAGFEEANEVLLAFEPVERLEHLLSYQIREHIAAERLVYVLR